LSSVSPGFGLFKQTSQIHDTLQEGTLKFSGGELMQFKGTELHFRQEIDEFFRYIGSEHTPKL